MQGAALTTAVSTDEETEACQNIEDDPDSGSAYTSDLGGKRRCLPMPLEKGINTKHELVLQSPRGPVSESPQFHRCRPSRRIYRGEARYMLWTRKPTIFTPKFGVCSFTECRINPVPIRGIVWINVNHSLSSGKGQRSLRAILQPPGIRLLPGTAR